MPLDLHEWSFHGFRLTAPSAGGNEASVVPHLEAFLESAAPLHNGIAREFERLFGRIVRTEQDLARTYLVMLTELALNAEHILHAKGDQEPPARASSPQGGASF
jgi:hypothetical protein